MGETRRPAAVFAGLSGCAVWSIPVLAAAAPLDMLDNGLHLGFVDVTMDDLLASPVAYFAVGVLVGGGVMGLAMGVARHRATKRLRHELEEASRSPVIIRIEGPGHVLDLRDAQRETPRATSGSSRQVILPAEDGVPAPEVVPASRPKRASVASEVERGEVAEEPEEVSETADLGRVHGLPEPLPMGRPSHVSARLDALLPPLEEELVASWRQQAARRQAPAPAPVDYAGVAERYVQGATAQADQSGVSRSATDAGRDSHRGGGVRSVLSGRLGGNMMEGLPVIERADGSTADIGTSWWEKTVGSTHSFGPTESTSQLGMQPVSSAQDPLTTSELRVRELLRAQRNAEAAGLSSAGTFGRPLRYESPSDRAATIASRISSFDLSLYPEEDDGEATSGEDMFEQAMRALDAQLPGAGVTTSEDAASITAATPLSENLETGYVVSPESLGETGEQEHTPDQDADVQAYVDYLMRDEMERRRDHRSFLTVFEGTGDLSDARRAASTAKHMATIKVGKEA